MTTRQPGHPDSSAGDVGADAAVALAPTPPTSSVPTAPSAPTVPTELTCPVCATTFAPRASGGRCPVCNEQVVPETLVTRDIRGVTPAMRWLREGGWRLVVLALFILYEAALLIYLWHSFADQHLL